MGSKLRTDCLRQFVSRSLRSYKLYFGAVVAIMAWVIIWYHKDIIFITTVIMHDTRLTQNLFIDVKCTMPVLDPFDKNVLEIVKSHNLPPINCTKGYTIALTQIPKGNCLKVNQGILTTHYRTTVKCRYRYIRRPTPAYSDDVTINSTATSLPLDGSCKRLSNSDNFLVVVCDDKEQKPTYINYHIYIGGSVIDSVASKRKTESQNIASPQLNVFLFGLDSTSGSNFIRTLPKTRRFLLDVLKVVELKGYNKVADNTLPNLIPVLTGRTYEELTWSVGKYLDRLFFYDSFPLIWKRFKAEGYVTYMAEDEPGMAMFNGGRRGFRQQPVDYYMRPFWLEIVNSLLFNTSSKLCLGGVPRHQLLLQWTKQFFRKCERENVPFFSLLWETEISHGYPNHLSVLDDDLYQFFYQSHKEGYFENTVFLLFGDHGSRWGRLRQTQTGKYEDRLPMNVVFLPFWMREKHKQLYANLKSNVDKLTTAFDTHETLLEIIRLKKSPNGNHQENTVTRGLSLLSKIPNDRTCANAGVESHWCTCLKHTPALTNSSEALLVSQHVVKHINTLLARVKAPCAMLYLKNTVSVYTMQPDNRLLSFTRASWYGQPSFGDSASVTFIDYFVTIVTRPGGAIFEATVRVYKERKTVNVTADISRLNLYKNQAFCVADQPNIKKYCFCKSLLNDSHTV